MAKKKMPGFLHKPTKEEILFNALLEDNHRLLQALDKTQHELLDSNKKLAMAKKQLSEMGADVSQFEFETNTRLDSQDADITDAQEAIGETVELIGDNSTDIEDLQLAVAEVIEMIS